MESSSKKQSKYVSTQLNWLFPNGQNSDQSNPFFGTDALTKKNINNDKQNRK